MTNSRCHEQHNTMQEPYKAMAMAKTPCKNNPELNINSLVLQDALHSNQKLKIGTPC